MTREEAIQHLENMKWLKGYDNTTVDGVPLGNVIDDIIALLKAQEEATIEPKRIDLEEETKAWLDKMDAVDALGTIADICIDWDGYRTADSLGGLINEIWAYARYCSNRLAKEQEPVEPKVIDTSNSRLYHNDMFKNYYCGNCGEFLHVVNRKDLFCSQCGRAVKW